MSITIIYHQKCQASLNILPILKEVKNYEIEYIDLSVDKVEADVNLDVVPMLIIDNKDIFRGKQAFDKLQEFKKKSSEKIVDWQNMDLGKIVCTWSWLSS